MATALGWGCAYDRRETAELCHLMARYRSALSAGCFRNHKLWHDILLGILRIGRGATSRAPAAPGQGTADPPLAKAVDARLGRPCLVHGRRGPPLTPFLFLIGRVSCAALRQSGSVASPIRFVEPLFRTSCIGAWTKYRTRLINISFDRYLPLSRAPATPMR
jgi:hypothetical protein